MNSLSYLYSVGKRDENYGIVEDVNVLFWNLIYALPFIYPNFDILNRYFDSVNS